MRRCAVVTLNVVRASALPMAFRCAASVRGGNVIIRETGEPADVGSAAHEALIDLAEGRGIQWDGIDAIAAKWSVPADGVRVLCAQAAKMWPDLAPLFPDASSEIELTVDLPHGGALTGHADFVSVWDVIDGGVTRRHAAIGDWKTGRRDSDYVHQMRAYAALLMLDDVTIDHVTSVVVWVREGEVERYTTTRAQMRAWVARLVAEVFDWDGTYRPGPHCGHCPRSHECVAVNAMVRRDVSAILDTPADMAAALLEMAPDDIVALAQKASLVAEYADRVRKAVRLHVIANGDVHGSSAVLTTSTETRREIDTLKAWPVLEAAGFTDEEMAACVDVSAGAAEKVIAKKAGRGNGAKAVREFKAALESAGAVKVREIVKLTERRTGS